MLWITVIITAIAIAWGWKNPRVLLPLLILSLPLEISREWFPHLSVVDKLGQFVGVIYLGRIATLTVIAYFIWSLIRAKEGSIYERNSREIVGELKHSPFMTALIIYILWGSLSLIWSVDPRATLVGIARLGLLSLLAMAVHDLIRKHGGYAVIPLSFAAVSTALAIVGIYEMISTSWLWLEEIYGSLGRYNATFVDTNIYARFLLIGIFATLFLMSGSPSWNYKLAGGIACALQLGALIGTGSRTAWLALFIMVCAIAFMIPRKSVLITLLAAVILAGLGIMAKPEYIQRIVEIKQNFSGALLQREYLIKCGVEMFLENPLTGVGLQGFQKVMLTRYADLIQRGVSLSHTSLITTAAELGIIGLGITALFFAQLYSKIPRALRKVRLRVSESIFLPNSNHVLFSILVVTSIFITAQAEGRFFEDPYLWIFVGYLSAIHDYEEVS